MTAGEFGDRRLRIRSGRDLKGHGRRPRFLPRAPRRGFRSVACINRLTVGFGLKPEIQAEGITGACRGYAETLVVDRVAGRFSFSKRIDGMRFFRMAFRDIWDEINGILIAADRCVHSGDWAHLTDDLDDKERYIWIVAEYADSTIQIRAAACDRSAVPEAPWLTMMREIRGALQSHLVFEVFDETAFLDARREGDVKYVSVCFNDYGQTYSYITEDAGIQAGDRVVVPCGPGNTQRIATVVEVRYYPMDRTPYPLEKTKRVIRRADAAFD